MFRKFFTSAAIAGLIAPPAVATDWTYEDPETGADRWGHLHTDFEMCERGIMQSPIDLGHANATGEIPVSVNLRPLWYLLTTRKAIFLPTLFTSS